jgi:hypothetical protein
MGIRGLSLGHAPQCMTYYRLAEDSYSLVESRKLKRRQVPPPGGLEVVWQLELALRAPTCWRAAVCREARIDLATTSRIVSQES